MAELARPCPSCSQATQQAVDVGVMTVENRIAGGRVDGAHVAADEAVHQVVRHRFQGAVRAGPVLRSVEGLAAERRHGAEIGEDRVGHARVQAVDDDGRAKLVRAAVDRGPRVPS